MWTQERELNNGIIQTNDNCVGCNRCISRCPVFGANIAREVDGQNRVYVDAEACILCGKCMDECPHDARVYLDDTQRFLEDLEAVTDGSRKRGISLIVAPSFPINYPQKCNMILGYLKHLGVNRIYSVSYGADISIWAHLKYLEQHPQNGYLAQFCPAIVNSVEKYHPNLVEHLMPVQSPMVCTAIYLKNVLGIEDDLAFLSPCIAKKAEVERPSTAGMVRYNVTFDHLLRQLDDVDISPYFADDYEIDYGLGALFPTPGGLKENVEYYVGLDEDWFVTQKEGEVYAYSYLDLYSDKEWYDDPYRARLIEIVNCSRSCIYGTGTEFKHTSSTHIPHAVNQIRLQKKRLSQDISKELQQPAQRLEALNRRFDHLNLEDFMISYTPQTKVQREVPREELEDAFVALLKTTEEQRNLNCGSCGYRTCKEMARAIALGYNYEGNCFHYVKRAMEEQRGESRLHQQTMELLQRSAPGANIDLLTGLGNRYAFDQGLERALRDARRSGKYGFLFSLDLDDFAMINESYGHNFGNMLLIAVTRYLQQIDAEAEIFRVGGDEFMLLLEEANEARAQGIAAQVTARMQEPWEIAGNRFYCTASLGVTRFPEADDGVNEIVRNADLALHEAKQKGKNSAVFYEHELDNNSRERIGLINRLRDSITRDFEGFEVYYQPWIGRDYRIVGAEALLRWRDAEGNFVSPGEFIPVAESVGLIVPIGEYVLRTAARRCREINRQFGDFMVSVNVSVKQLNQPDVFEQLSNILSETGVDPRNMVLEITESLGMDNVARQRSILERFKKFGVRVALDDFGTGYSSLSYLNELPLDLVKIDRSFIRDIEENRYSEYVLSTMAQLMGKMGRWICVEGVEKHSQLEYCIEAGVDIVQGYLFYKPMPAEELMALLAEQRALPVP